MAFNVAGSISPAATKASTTLTNPLTLTTNADGTSWVTFPSSRVSSLTIPNATGVALIYRIDGGGSVQIPNGGTANITGITNANQVGIKRNDTTPAVSVVVTASATTLTQYTSIPSVSTLVHAFALTRLIPTYTGPCIRVRRTSDNAQLDIGFDANGDLDVAALKVFGGTCFVVTWYDQSGNGQDVTMATQATQPQIILNGVVWLINGKPAIYFNGVNELDNAGTGVPTGTNPWTITFNYQYKFAYDQTLTNQNNSTLAWWGAANATNLSANAAAITNNSYQEMLLKQNGGVTQPTPSVYEDGFPKNATATYDGTTYRVYTYGTQRKSIVPSPALSVGAGQFRIGYDNSGSNVDFVGYMNECIMWNTVLSATDIKTLSNGQDARNSASPKVYLTFWGDSIAEGRLGVSNPNGFKNSWAYLILANLASQGVVFKVQQGSVIGAAFSDQETNASAADGIDASSYDNAGLRVLVIPLGRNDIGNQSHSATTTYNDAVTFVGKRKATGKWDRIVLFTGYYSTSISNSQPYLDLANLYRAGMQPGGTLRAAGATDMVDLQQDVNFQSRFIGNGLQDDGVTPQNPIYVSQTDHIHPTDAGHLAIYNLFKAQLPWLGLK